MIECAGSTLACLSLTKTELNTNTLDQQTANPEAPGTLDLQFDDLGFSLYFAFFLCFESTKRHLIMPHIYSVGIGHTALLYCRLP